MDIEPTNRGQQRLLELTEEHGSGVRCAEVTDLKPNQISQYRRGIKPNGPGRTKMMRLGIPSQWWDEPPVDGAKA